jgi:hypothetical protein
MPVHWAGLTAPDVRVPDQGSSTRPGAFPRRLKVRMY